MREAIELKDPTPMYFAQPLEENLFEWHFTILGPSGTDFEGGLYHGRIILPTEYPMKPPSIILLTVRSMAAVCILNDVIQRSLSWLKDAALESRVITSRTQALLTTTRSAQLGTHLCTSVVLNSCCTPLWFDYYDIMLTVFSF